MGSKFTDEQVKQLESMGLKSLYAGGYYIVGSDKADWYTWTVWATGKVHGRLDWAKPYDPDKFLADRGMNEVQALAGQGVEFDCPITAAAWLLLELSNG